MTHEGVRHGRLAVLPQPRFAHLSSEPRPNGVRLLFAVAWLLCVHTQEIAGSVAVGKRCYLVCLLFNSGCLPRPQAPSGEKRGDMSSTTDSRVGRAALRADGATKADAAAMTARGFAGTCAVAIGPGGEGTAHEHRTDRAVHRHGGTPGREVSAHCQPPSTGGHHLMTISTHHFHEPRSSR